MRIGDLNKTVTLGEVLDMFEDILGGDSEEVITLVNASFEDWTDEGGTHQSPFTKSVDEGISDMIESRLDALVDVAEDPR